MALYNKMLQFIVIVCSLATISQAFTVPEGQPNGVYYYDSDTDTHTLVSAAATESTEGSIEGAIKFPRGLPGSYSCGNILVPNLDYTSALGQFVSKCYGQTLSKGAHIYSIYGDVKLFRCAYGKSACSAQDLKNFLGYVDTQCGSTMDAHMTGWVKVNKGLSYGATTPDASAC
ncbi:hypothetical protein BDZ45DRAFT_779374 [Acephala macrosclerotiorum]|nr:hypothetical protein BDZ45DRAFT_779374 [Acephala macrosclerotiorum]